MKIGIRFEYFNWVNIRFAILGCIEVSVEQNFRSDSLLIDGKDLNVLELVHVILVQTKRNYQACLKNEGAYQLRYSLIQLVAERSYLIKLNDLAFAQSDKVSLTLVELEFYQFLMHKNIGKLSENGCLDLTTIVRCEKAFLAVVKSVLNKVSDKTARNFLASLAASLQISLDNLELMSI